MAQYLPIVRNQVLKQIPKPPTNFAICYCTVMCTNFKSISPKNSQLNYRAKI